MSDILNYLHDKNDFLYNYYCGCGGLFLFIKKNRLLKKSKSNKTLKRIHWITKALVNI